MAMPRHPRTDTKLSKETSDKEAPSVAHEGGNTNRAYHEDISTGRWYVDTQNRFGVAKVGESDLGVISLFSGAGGLDIGLEQAGFQTRLCIEIDEHCRETLRINRPAWILAESGDASREPGDIRRITSEEILELSNLKKGQAALVVGGAPCQPFSNIGRKQGINDPKNGDLFLEFVRVVRDTRPKAFLFENVAGITQGRHQQVVDYMKSHFSDAGYEIDFQILNSADYGVPQKRTRFFMIGIREASRVAWPLPTHSGEPDSETTLTLVPERHSGLKAWNTVGDAFTLIPKNYDSRNDYVVMNISEVVKHRMTFVGPGENFKSIPMNLRPNCWKTGKHQGADTFGRMRLDMPSHTIRTAAYNPSKGQYIHPTENRGLNSIEMAVLQGFPVNEWTFCVKGKRATLKSVGMQIGNAVPPPLGKALGLAIRAQITG